MVTQVLYFDFLITEISITWTIPVGALLGEKPIYRHTDSRFCKPSAWLSNSLLFTVGVEKPQNWRNIDIYHTQIGLNLSYLACPGLYVVLTKVTWELYTPPHRKIRKSYTLVFALNNDFAIVFNRHMDKFEQTCFFNTFLLAASWQKS